MGEVITPGIGKALGYNKNHLRRILRIQFQLYRSIQTRWFCFVEISKLFGEG